MNLALDGRTALVMGGSSGLGLAIAQALSREGVKVMVSARESERLTDAAAAVNGIAIPADFAQRGAVSSLVAAALQLLGRVDILVVNSGGPPATTFENTAEAVWREYHEMLWMSAVDSIRVALPAMRLNGWGRILLISSISAREPLPRLVVSSALRAGLHGLVNALNKEVAAAGITVNAVMPGYILTERLAEVSSDRDAITAKIPAGRIGAPEELASLVAFLASENAAYVTGQAIACDGGLLNSI